MSTIEHDLNRRTANAMIAGVPSMSSQEESRAGPTNGALSNFNYSHPACEKEFPSNKFIKPPPSAPAGDALRSNRHLKTTMATMIAQPFRTFYKNKVKRDSPTSNSPSAMGEIEEDYRGSIQF